MPEVDFDASRWSVDLSSGEKVLKVEESLSDSLRFRYWRWSTDDVLSKGIGDTGELLLGPRALVLMAPLLLLPPTPPLVLLLAPPPPVVLLLVVLPLPPRRSEVGRIGSLTDWSESVLAYGDRELSGGANCQWGLPLLLLLLLVVIS